MFYNWGAFAYRHRKIIPVVIIAIIIAMQVLFGSKLADRLSQEGWEDPGADSTAAAVIEQDTFGRDNSGDVILLVTSPNGVAEGEVFDAANRQIEALRDQFPEEIESISSYFATPNPQQITEDGTKAFAAIGLAGDGEQTLRDFRTIQPALEAIELPGGAEIEIAGATAVADALDKGMADDSPAPRRSA